MRTRKDIEETLKEIIMGSTHISPITIAERTLIEILLDIRDLLATKEKKQ